MQDENCYYTEVILRASCFNHLNSFRSAYLRTEVQIVRSYYRFASRLSGIKENQKFQKNGKNNVQVPGLKVVVDDAKQQHNVK